MAVGTSLLELVLRLRRELGRADSASIGVDELPQLQETINHVYATLYLDFDWPHLRKVFDPKVLNAGQRYYDFPEGLNVERIEDVQLWYSSLPRGLCRGITIDDYGLHDPTNDERSDPALKWDLRWAGSKAQFEVWPLPNGSVQKVYFEGFVDAPRLVNESDRCLLDDTLVVLFAASEHLEGEAAAAKRSLAENRYRKLKHRLSNPAGPVRMGLGEDRDSKRLTVNVQVS